MNKNKKNRTLDRHSQLACLGLMNLNDLSRLMGVSLKTIDLWIKGKEMSRSNRRRVTQAERLIGSLSFMFSPEVIHQWLVAPNSKLDGATPLDVIERGESDRLWMFVWEKKYQSQCSTASHSK
jgi:Protein of unknown function (DUF2384)